MSSDRNPEALAIVVEAAIGATLAAPPVATPPDNHSGAMSDGELVSLWLSTKRADNTRKAYGRDAGVFFRFLASQRLQLRFMSVGDLQRWIDALEGAESTLARRVSAVKSLLTFGHRTGYLQFNVGAVLTPPRVPNDIAERIMSEGDAHELLRSTSNAREQALVRFLYGSGCRIAELCSMQWKHVHPQDSGEASVTIHGKGGKTRHVLVSASVVDSLEALRPFDGQGYVFATKSGRPLDRHNAWKMVKRIARRAGLSSAISPHWFRHAHASHALDRAAPVHLVQATLGHASLATTGRYAHARPTEGSSRYVSA